LLRTLADDLGGSLAEQILTADQSSEKAIGEQRARIVELQRELDALDRSEARELSSVAHSLIRKSVWIVGGDGWAYDIGAGGLDHVLASGTDVNILVLDSEVYSNTGGQMSKATPRGAVAKFATGGKHSAKKDLAMQAINYDNVYVARVAMGASDTQTVKAFFEAEAHHGPSLIIAYSHCIAHGYDMALGLHQQKSAVLSGHWPLMRYNPALTAQGKNPFQLDSKPPSIPLGDYIYEETRYSALQRGDPETARELLEMAEEDIKRQWRLYQNRASLTAPELKAPPQVAIDPVKN
jgi:pyruvate-ferredoxin/flavodoxin oxidoreductase